MGCCALQHRIKTGMFANNVRFAETKSSDKSWKSKVPGSTKSDVDILKLISWALIFILAIVGILGAENYANVHRVHTPVVPAAAAPRNMIVSTLLIMFNIICSGSGVFNLMDRFNNESFFPPTIATDQQRLAHESETILELENMNWKELEKINSTRTFSVIDCALGSMFMAVEEKLDNMKRKGVSDMKSVKDKGHWPRKMKEAALKNDETKLISNRFIP